MTPNSKATACASWSRKRSSTTSPTRSSSTSSRATPPPSSSSRPPKIDMHPRHALLLLSTLLAATTPVTAALPTGPSPAPIDLPHFPSRLHAVLFRNWNLVEPDRLARVLETTPQNLAALADSMGLPPQRPIPPSYRRRLYISIIKRNWHLLPYDQLLTLLDMNQDQLAHALREDDFLWIKLGALKPKCDRVLYAP